jgi:signal transduction histidine kinase
MDLKELILISVTFLNLLLGFLIYLGHRKNLANIFYGLLAFSLSLWTFCMLRYASIDINYPEQILLWSKLLYMAGIGVPLSLILFAYAFPDGKLKANKFLMIIAVVLYFFLAYITFLTNQIISGLDIVNTANRVLIHGPLYPLYFLYFFAGMTWAFIILFLKLRKADHKLKIQLRYILVGAMTPTLFTGVINMILPATGNFYLAWMGPSSSLVMVASIGYAIVKHRLMDIKVIATQVFASLLALISLIEIFGAKTPTEIGMRVAIFTITLIFSIFLIRSVLNEVKRREQMEVLTKELKHASKKLKEANKELKRLDDAKSEFLSIASHQLRTPLTAVKGFVSMILEGSFGKVPPLIKTNLEKVYQASERLIGLVESLLNISRIEAGRLEFDVQPVDLVPTVQGLIEDFKKRVDDKGLKLNYYPEKNLPLCLADAQKVKEVISNMIDNSLKYTPKGEINVSLHKESQSIVFACQDTGIGVDPDDLPRLFEKFVRGKGMMQVYTEGTGLGMYFARMVVENMGGRIWAESDGKGKGSKFCFSLPMADKGKAVKVA